MLDQYLVNRYCKVAALGDSQVVLVVKNPPANAGDIRDVSSIPGLGKPSGGGHGKNFSILAWRIQWQKSLVGYSPLGYNELDTTEVTQHATHTCLRFQTQGTKKTFRNQDKQYFNVIFKNKNNYKMQNMMNML